MGFFDKIGDILGAGGGGGTVGGIVGLGLGGPIGAAIGAPLGGFLGRALDKQEDPNAYNREMFERNVALQKEFAQQGVRWRVEDAKAAGVHPLFALGASGASYSPVTVMDAGPKYSPLQDAMAMGQDVTRALMSTRTQSERDMMSLQMAALQADLDGKVIDNQIKLAELNKANAVGPAFPSAGSDNFIPGQGNTPLVKDKPLERVVSAPGRPAQEAGWRPDVSYSRTDTGLTPVVPESLSESLEDDVIGKALWRLRNQVVPNFTGSGKPPLHMLPKGADDWDWNGSKQEWQPVKGKGSYPFGRFKDDWNYYRKHIDK